MPKQKCQRSELCHTLTGPDRQPTETNSRLPSCPLLWQSWWCGCCPSLLLLLLVAQLLLLLLWHALKSSQVSAVSHWIYWNFRFALSQSRRSLGCRGLFWPGLSFSLYTVHPRHSLCRWGCKIFPLSLWPPLTPSTNNSVNVSMACGWQRSASGWFAVQWNLKFNQPKYYMSFAFLFPTAAGQCGCWVIFRP